ncbi:MAG: T9SS type A sorting domain-containing protein [Cyclobacteriaceae bacterium]
MKKTNYLFCKVALALMLIGTFATSALAGTYSGGTGTSGDPYQISTAADLVELSNTAADLGADFVLTADIDMTGQTFNPIGTGSAAETAFTGHFDGDGYVISNLTVSDPDAGFANGLGMFGALIGATIENIGLEDVNVSSPTNADERVAGIAGYSDFSTIQNCYVKGGTIQGKYRVASIVGWNKSTNNTVTNCWSSAAINYGSQAWMHGAGIVGTNDGNVSKCLFYGTITNDVASNNLGGIVGTAGGTVSLCYYIDAITEKGNGASTGSTALSTAQLAVESNYVGFDFASTWVMDPVSPNYATLQKFTSVVVQKPTVAITAPVDGSGFSVGDVINISATATPNATSNSAITTVTYDIGSGAVAMTNTSGNTWTGSFTSTEIDHTISVTATDAANEFSSAAVSISAAPTYSGGDGSTGDPFQIASAADLMALSGWDRHWDKDFIQTADIDMSGQDFKNIGASPAFTGSYDGQSNTISNLTISSIHDGQGVTGGGLFGVATGAELSNIGLINPNIDLPSQERVGGIVGAIDGAGSVDNCFVLGGRVAGNFRVGGIVGYTPVITISNVFASCVVDGGYNYGGIVGQLGWDAAWASGSALTNAAFYGSSTGNAVVGIEYSLGAVPVSITNSYYLAGSGTTDANATALSFANAAIQGSYSGFDFVTTPVWEMESNCYPVLSSFSGADFSGICSMIIWDGAAWSNGTGPTSSSDDAFIHGAMTVSQEMIVGNLSVSGAGSLTINSGASVAINGAATGNATIVRNTMGNSGYSIVGAPVSGVSVDNLAADYLYSWDGSAWSTPTGTMTPGVGYFAGYDAASPSVSLSGALVSGDVKTSITNAGDGFNIVANPYAAAISISTFLGANSDIAASVYLWNDGGSNVGGDRGGDYVTVNNVGSVGSVDLSDGVSGLNTQAANTHIGSMQGFLVSTTEANAYVDFTPAMQDASSSTANSDANFYRKAEQATLKLSLSGAHYNEVLFGFREDATEGVDRLFDAVKKSGNDNLSFYSFIDNKKYAIQGLPVLNNESIISLGYDIKEDGMYELSINEMEGFNTEYIVVANHNGADYNLTDGVANLELTAGQGHIQLTLTAASVLNTTSALDFKVYNQDGTLNIVMPNGVDQGDIQILDISGRTMIKFNSQQFFNNTWAKEVQLKHNNVYIVRVLTNESVLTQKFIY